MHPTLERVLAAHIDELETDILETLERTDAERDRLTQRYLAAEQEAQKERLTAESLRGQLREAKQKADRLHDELATLRDDHASAVERLASRLQYLDDIGGALARVTGEPVDAAKLVETIEALATRGVPTPPPPRAVDAPAIIDSARVQPAPDPIDDDGAALFDETGALREPTDAVG